VTGKRAPADVLREARKADSLAKRTRVLAVIDEMKGRDEPITFLSVARVTRVSNWLVYADGVREHVEAARKGQAGRQARSQQAGTTASAASLATYLEITRAELRRTRDERERLKSKVQRGLGHQVAQAGTTELAARIRDLTARIQSQDSEPAQARAEVTSLTKERDTALDEVAGLPGGPAADDPPAEHPALTMTRPHGSAPGRDGCYARFLLRCPSSRPRLNRAYSTTSGVPSQLGSAAHASARHK
jgi:hypothetical protein